MSAMKITSGIRQILIESLGELRPKPSMDSNLQQASVLQLASKKLAESLAPAPQVIKGHSQMMYSRQPPPIDSEMEQALLTQWGELFRTGLLAWGLNLNNPGPPFFHLTETGKAALADATRDPSNPAGYLQHLDTLSTLNPVSRSYLVEGLDCYVAGLTKAAAVMVGAAAESIILELAEHTQQRLNLLGQTPPKDLADWRVKRVTDALRSIFETHKKQMEVELRESVDANWPAFAYQIRSARNEAGHPISIDPVTPDRVHAMLLTFPELAKIAGKLKQWIGSSLN